MSAAQEIARCPLDDLRGGEGVRVPSEVGPIAVFLVDGEILAVQDTCTHEDASLAEGFLEDHVIECPLHGGQFDLRSGAAVCLPAQHPLRRFGVRSDGEFVYVTT
ncbi:non-heme iron oxygenase ferredoxin subunit [Pseudonocardia acidicola]|uniref:Non-heme iron oxygenase ferredoxin subunit n=1 Tax=Pseudonocardia acidicola TaxID=2724939 RepID=A0ABX1SF47_9PSEU|nr:non-heme iron oxygenase ferredoxin subunit [Pseudonocardia acidicola]NMI00180.1 non-heme iron oxygenase ferredoxin subunit [Pseudonocardia acidicola]